ncbi:hypothetical protein F4778DRAFT_634719 [Xylariomycetidae sp. FL2044]|nr:hypothetical protein F4778DRAFT_634719 [Xylariomycetidae sp. FL2044]
MTDPWDWDVNQVVAELFSSHRPWDTSQGPLKLPPRDQLEEKLKDHEVDGEVLLTFNEAELCSELGIQKLKHKATFRNVINNLRLKSKQYRLHKKRQASELEAESDEGSLVDGQESNLEAAFGPFQPDGKITRHTVASGHSKDAVRFTTPTLQNELMSFTSEGHANSQAKDHPHPDPPLSAISSPIPKPDRPFPSPTASKEPSPDPVVPEEQPRKKRRMAPTLISTEVDSSTRRHIPTEADLISKPTVLQGARQNGPRSIAYLGANPFSRVEIVDTDDVPLILTEDDKSMNFVQRNPGLRGRRVQIHKLFKRRLLRNHQFGRGLRYKSDAILNDPDHDDILPLYGDSDDEYDEKTWRDIQAELDERAAAKAAVGLSQEEVDTVIENAIQEIASNWKETKLPKVERKGHRVWTNARNSGLKMSIELNQRKLQELEKRCQKYKETYRGEEYADKDKGDLARQAVILLEPTVTDMEYTSWVLRVIKSSSAPKKPPPLPRAAVKKPKQKKSANEEDVDVLTSESEDGLDNFIVNDEEDDRNPAAHDDSDIYDVDNSVANDAGDTDPGNEPTVGEQKSSPMVIDSPGSGKNSRKNSSSPGAGAMLDEDNVTAVDDGDVVMESEPKEAPEPSKAIAAHKSPHSNKNPITTPRKPRIEIDLVTPDHPRASVPSEQRNYKNTRVSSKKRSTGQSVLIMGIDDLDPREKLVAEALATLDPAYLGFIFSIPATLQPGEIWLDLVLRALEKDRFPQPPYELGSKGDDLVAFMLLRLWEMWKDNKHYKLRRYKMLDEESRQRIRGFRETHHLPTFDPFIRFLHRLSDRFEWSRPARNGTSRESRTPLASNDTAKASTEPREDSNDADSAAEEGAGRRKKTVFRNKEAQNLRDADKARKEEQETRRQRLRRNLIALEMAGDQSAGSQRAMIINESKTDDQGFVRIHKEIASRIKDHQVAGVRFMWNQIVDRDRITEQASNRQGCLLAHTMGLGKTMQIITLLVAIYEAAQSEDPSISSQIPEEIRESRTLVLCPPTLVNNWMDELLTWTPNGHCLGEFFKVDSKNSAERELDVRSWKERGGVLLIGYNMFKKLLETPELRETLLNSPNLVVADEAHMMKNSKSQIHMATAGFKTHSRIALTGSPLANNVEEYFAMIDWVAPNYLGDIKEFRDVFGRPIKDGLSSDSTFWQRKKALRVLHLLKETVAPKVNRATIAVLKADIPIKKEFVLFIPLTKVQKDAYEAYVTYQRQHSSSGQDSMLAAIHPLGLICAHPDIFRNHLKGLKNTPMKNGTQSKSDEDQADNFRATLPAELISAELSLLNKAERIADISASWKIPILLAILDESKLIGDSVLVFSQSIPTLDYIERTLRLKKYSFSRLDGKSPIADRQKMVKEFNEGQTDVFLISTTAGGLGLNIVSANRVIIFDSRFNPQNEQQAVGRAYRIGQKKPVFVYRFVCGGTFENDLATQAIGKMQLASRVVDKKNPVPKAQKIKIGYQMPTETPQTDIYVHRGKDGVLDHVLNSQSDGIRAITMMETYEEEEAETAAMTEEDLQIINRIKAQVEAQRNGRPLPYTSTEFDDMLGRTRNSLPGPNAAGQLAQPDDLLHLPGMNGASGGSVVPQSINDNVNTSYDPAQSVGGNLLNAGVPLPPVHGVTTRTRLSGQDEAWDNPRAFRGELVRAYRENSSAHDEQRRREVAQAIDQALLAEIEPQPVELQRQMKWAVMIAASSGRFIEAMCRKAYQPEQLARMVPKDIEEKQRSWDAMSEEDWEAEKRRFAAQEIESDPICSIECHRFREEMTNCTAQMTKEPWKLS